jgi:hypothetical protein
MKSCIILGSNGILGSAGGNSFSVLTLNKHSGAAG